MVTCEDILNLKLDGMQLIAGEKGLHRMVSWTYMVQTRPYADHMNRGNFALIVVDYVRFDYEEAARSMEELNELGISGLAVSTVDDREDVPQSMIDRANELELPLFYIRWEGASFVDIAQSIGSLIVQTGVENKKTGDYLYNLLFGYEINDKYVEKISGQFGLDFSRPYRVGVIVIDRKYGVNLEQDEHTYEYYADCLNREYVVNASRCGSIFSSMLEAGEMEDGRELYLCGKIYQLLARLTEKQQGEEDYVERAKTYLESNYMREISIVELAEQMNLNRSYFSTLFRRKTGRSPQQYLTDYRMEKACELMVEHGCAPGEAALSTGYPDIFSFSRMFKRKFGVSPREYLRQNREKAE